MNDESRSSNRPVPKPVGPAQARGTPSFIRPQNGGSCLAIKLQPKASRNEIQAPLGAELRIAVTAPPVDSAANEALLRLLADTLGCPRGAVQLLRGQTSRHKVVWIRGLAPEAVLGKLSKPS